MQSLRKTASNGVSPHSSHNVLALSLSDDVRKLVIVGIFGEEETKDRLGENEGRSTQGGLAVANCMHDCYGAKMSSQRGGGWPAGEGVAHVPGNPRRREGCGYNIGGLREGNSDGASSRVVS